MPYRNLSKSARRFILCCGASALFALCSVGSATAAAGILAWANYTDEGNVELSWATTGISGSINIYLGDTRIAQVPYTQATYLINSTELAEGSNSLHIKSGNNRITSNWITCEAGECQQGIPEVNCEPVATKCPPDVKVAEPREEYSSFLVLASRASLFHFMGILLTLIFLKI